MVEFIKSSPPEPNGNRRGWRGRAELEAIAVALRAKPTHWAKVRTYPKGDPKSMQRAHVTAHNWRNGKTDCFPLGEFEFTARRDPDNDDTPTIYGRAL